MMMIIKLQIKLLLNFVGQPEHVLHQSGTVILVITPLYLQELVTSGAGGPERFFKDANRHFAVG